MAKIHFVLHARRSRDDAYKSFVAATLAEHVMQRGDLPLCIDVDSLRSTFSGYKTLHVKPFTVMKNGKVDAECFQNLVQAVRSSPFDVVIDFPEKSLLPVSQYLGANNVTQALRRLGHEIVVHVVSASSLGLAGAVYEIFPLALEAHCKAAFIAWQTSNSRLYQPENAHPYVAAPYFEERKSMPAVVDVPSIAEEGCGFDLTNMMGRRHTFAEAMNPSRLVDMDRPRVRILKDHLFNQLDRIAVL